MELKVSYQAPCCVFKLIPTLTQLQTKWQQWNTPKMELQGLPEAPVPAGWCASIGAQTLLLIHMLLPSPEELVPCGPAHGWTLPCCSACLCWPHFLATQWQLPRYSQLQPSAEQTFLEVKRHEWRRVLGGGGGGVTPSSVPLLYCDAIPRSSTALTSAWQLMRSSNMPSTARRAARIKGVVPSCMRASRSVALFRIRICPREKG